MGNVTPFERRKFALDWLAEHGPIDSTNNDYFSEFCERFKTRTLGTALAPLRDLWRSGEIQRHTIRYQPNWAGRARWVNTYSLKPDAKNRAQ